MCYYNSYDAKPTVDKSRCRCGAGFGDEDRYCRECGTRRGEAYYIPTFEIMPCIYGPAPVKRTHRCGSCGYTYSTVVMVDNDKYCPQCGGVTEPIASDEDRW